jgi:hypothetical protein
MINHVVAVASTPLLAVVPATNLWIDANFKETQLAGVRIGQPATVVADIYGDDVVYHGKVVGLDNVVAVDISHHRGRLADAHARQLGLFKVGVNPQIGRTATTWFIMAKWSG